MRNMRNFCKRALVVNLMMKLRKYLDVLIKIKQHENGKKVTFKNEYWDQKLQRDIQSNIVEPSIPEKLHLSASSIETYKTCH